MQYYIRVQNQVYGPYEENVMAGYVNEGRLNPHSEVSSDGVNWTSAGNFPALFPSSGIPQPPPMENPYQQSFSQSQPQSPYGQDTNPYAPPSGYQPPQNYRMDGGVPDNSGLATASMILGIVSIFASCIAIFGYITSIIGLILGIRSLGSRNRKMAIAGIVLSIVGFIFSIISSIIGVMITSGNLQF